MSSHQFRSSENDNASKAESAASRESRPPTSTWIRRKAPAEVIDLPNSADSVVSSLPADSVSARLVAALVERGVTQFFGVPGGPICPLFEALRLNDAAALVESRHESHAAFAAVAYYRATRQVAAIVVTAGPGLTNAINGIASAAAEGVPLLVIAGDVAWSTHGGCLAQNSGPEGLNFEQLVAPLTRCQVRITNGRSGIGQALSALDAATSPTRPDPSLVVLPIDRALESVPEMEVPQASLKTTVAPPRASVVQVAA